MVTKNGYIGKIDNYLCLEIAAGYVREVLIRVSQFRFFRFFEFLFFTFPFIADKNV
jgi:hypothetical protein